MPIAKFKRVYEVSSEDEVHSAANLLVQKPKMKWKTQKAGEKSAYVILEMDPHKIVGIDIGNEHSAYIEVSGAIAGRPMNFLEILITSSFMTPTESKNSDNANRVRCFGQEGLVETTVSHKIAFLKVVCTQPFNKFVQYGLSFIKVHVTEPEKVVLNSSCTIGSSQEPPISLFDSGKLLNKFSLRENSPDSESESSGSLFKRWKLTKDNEGSLSTAAAIRQASRNPSTNATSSSAKPSTSFEALAKLKIEQLKKNPIKGESSDTKCSHRETTPPTGKRSLETERKSSKKQKLMTITKCRPFEKLLDGVVFVISGIQNPDRAMLRKKATAMGAKYKADWEHGCTHLICAFVNTPKYNQVKGKGKIVTRAWIEKCFDLKKYLPWRRYALSSDDQSALESDEEILDETLMQTTSANAESIQIKSLYDNEPSIVERETSSANIRSDGSGSDTDDEIARTTQKLHSNLGKNNAAKTNIKSKPLGEDGSTTEEEEYLIEKIRKNAEQTKTMLRT